MISEFCKAWEKHNGNLREYFETHPQSEYDSYKKILRLVIECVVNQEVSSTLFDLNNITEIDNGDYQGALIFLVPRETYQPDPTDYIATYVFYGSCSGCDTLLGISEYDDGLPNEEQVNDYMQLALHLLQHAKYIFSNGDEDGID